MIQTFRFASAFFFRGGFENEWCEPVEWTSTFLSPFLSVFLVVFGRSLFLLTVEFVESSSDVSTRQKFVAQVMTKHCFLLLLSLVAFFFLCFVLTVCKRRNRFVAYLVTNSTPL